jgi:hypothetical protein
VHSLTQHAFTRSASGILPYKIDRMFPNFDHTMNHMHYLGKRAGEGPAGIGGVYLSGEGVCLSPPISLVRESGPRGIPTMFSARSELMFKNV